MSLILNICYLIYSQYEGEEIRVSIHNRILYPSLRDMLTKSGEALIGSILRAVHHLFELQDKQSAVGYIYKIVKNSTKEDMGKIIEQLESNELKGRVFVITLAGIWNKFEGIAQTLIVQYKRSHYKYKTV